MVREGIPMLKVLEVLKERYGAKVVSIRKIASSLGISRPTVRKYLDLASSVGICHWPLRDEEGEKARLREALYPEREGASRTGFVIPEWAEVEKELTKTRKSGVTLWLLWEEYREREPQGLGYSQFCRLFKDYRKRKDIPLHHPHAPGQELYVDYSGPKIRIEPPGTKPSWVSLFVAVMGRSDYTFAYATRNMRSASWILAHRKAFEYLGGVPTAVVPDRTTTAIVSRHKIDPRLHPGFRAMGEHYGFEIYPARGQRPRDKGAVENGVLDAQRRLMAPLRHRKFASIEELNEALRERLEIVNRTPFQKREGSRRSVFEEEDRPALGPLPATPFDLESWEICRVPPDHHVPVEGIYYSAPYTLVGQDVTVRLTATTVEIFHREERVASHVRPPDRKNPYRTQTAHRPPNHKGYLEQSQEGFLSRASRVGPGMVAFFESLFELRKYPPLAYRTCQGILALQRTYPVDRIDAACIMALNLRSLSWRTVEGILKHGADRTDRKTPVSLSSASHENIRGAAAFLPENVP
ncbi:integrase catalytic subunit, partial [mine drainage metagenome]